MAPGEPGKPSRRVCVVISADAVPVLYSLYVYAPSEGAPIIFIVLFGISAVFHIWQCYRYKAVGLVGLHPLCAVLFTAGYSLRAWGARNYLYLRDDKTPLLVFVVSQVFIYICPPLLELANYHVLGRVFRYVPHCAPVPPHRVARLFGGSMAVVEVVNALGVSLAANPSSSSGTQGLGAKLTIAAVALQLVLVAVFAGLAVCFRLRLARSGLLGPGSAAAAAAAVVVSTVLAVLGASTGLIFARCVYRMAEHAGGATRVELDDLGALRRLSPVLRYEVYFYVFEAGLMLANSVVWNIWHPGRFLPREHRVHLGRDGVEVVGEREVDGRSGWARVGNVLTFGVFFGRKREKGTGTELEGVGSGRCGDVAGGVLHRSRAG
ncbi:Lipid-translocating exporter-like protein RTA1 [Colletotrichum orbiculare MAFF 240422]|uniref:Lipid-translocating exporter-like protein RTA1 n=1 Tax=Colletotrichum orbiculare (strain 104-T / ATCC 96160 / CBS 514.97 / LARS 414 / MAFF 240422) TaxID=1213857 RepID=N4VFL2_COLOR|nr:Lipid-translocating exporter-like protein RTA1 [Colletotrichum orbiculare MAFF 240422]